MSKRLEYIGSSCNELVLTFHFVVIFGNEFFAFKSISGIGMKRNFEYVSEGGRNGYPIRLINPQVSPYELTFERGIPVRSNDSPILSDYFFDDDYQFSKNIRGTVGTIYVLNNSKEVKAEYTFTVQGLSSWSVGKLDAMDGVTPLIESMTVIHNGLKRVPVEYKTSLPISRKFYTTIG